MGIIGGSKKPEHHLAPKLRQDSGEAGVDSLYIQRNSGLLNCPARDPVDITPQLSLPVPGNRCFKTRALPFKCQSGKAHEYGSHRLAQGSVSHQYRDQVLLARDRGFLQQDSLVHVVASDHANGSVYLAI